MSINEQHTEPGLGRQTRWLICTVLIAVAVGQAAGKILAVNAVDLARIEQSRVEKALGQERVRLERQGLTGDALQTALDAAEDGITRKVRLQRPFLSGNDRSRWMAIRALAENGNHHIEPFFEERTWDTIDMVQHPGRDGELHLYSSKPPLLMVLLSGPYWVLMNATGLTLGEAPYLLGRAMLLLFNGGALLTLLVCVARLIERVGFGDVDRLFAMAAAACGTQLAAFAPVLNNHLFAAAATAVACDAWLRLLDSDDRRGGLSLRAGLAAGLATACDLPALALVAVIGLSLLIKRPAETLRGYAVGVGLVAIAFFGTNYWAHESLRPPYAHRSETDPADNWYDYAFTVRGETRDSYWRNRQGIDVGEASKATYALHALVGHHGVFSLTPVWLLSLLGGARLLASRDSATRQLALATALITAACLVFYLGMRPQGDRNYGGSTNGFRWLFWLAPMWLAMMPATIDRLKNHHLGFALAAALLAWSAMSASYPTWNPWTHPWVYHWMDWMGFRVL